FDAGVGSQGTKRATASVTAATASPTATKRTSTPLRTLASLLNTQQRRRLRTSVTNLYETSFRATTRGTRPRGPYLSKRPAKGEQMGIGVSLLLIAAGAILVWGVTGSVGGVDEDDGGRTLTL